MPSLNALIGLLNNYTVELHLSGTWLSGSTIVRFCLVFRVNLLRILQK